MRIRIKKSVFRILSAASKIASIFILISAVMYIAGIRTYILRSGSMEPAFKKGSIIFADTHIRYDDLRAGDVVVYQDKTGSLIMHRYLGNNTLKGDRNKITEHVNLKRQMIARVCFCIPSLPYLHR